MSAGLALRQFDLYADESMPVTSSVTVCSTCQPRIGLMKA